MRSIVGVQSGVQGTLRVLGEEAGSPGVRGRVGYVTQAASIYGDLTARENLEFFAAIQGVGTEQVRAALATVDLAEAAEKTNPDAVDSGTSGSGRNTTGNDGGSGSGGASSANES